MSSIQEQLNSLHPSLQFTFEKECNQSLPFLDVMVEKAPPKFVTSVYRKPIFTGQYIRWNSFSPQKRKTNLISTLSHRALSIYSQEKIQDELDTITSILLNNGSPEHVIKTSISKKIQQFNAPVKFGLEKSPIYLRLPYIGPTSTKFETQIKTAVKTCFTALHQRSVSR